MQYLMKDGTWETRDTERCQKNFEEYHKDEIVKKVETVKIWDHSWGGK